MILLLLRGTEVWKSWGSFSRSLETMVEITLSNFGHFNSICVRCDSNGTVAL